ncbi:hypothetical protein [Flavobacterium sp.]|uniref:hypothetical protein n=2 Tax=Flavobacterium TaxID=237 RepID=UPI0039E2DA74
MKSYYNPYIRDEGKRVFVQSFCIYFDILGFSEKINEIQKNGLSYFNNYLSTLENIISHLTEYYNFGDENKNKKFELKIFTDNFVIGFPINDDGEIEFSQIFDVISYIQIEFIKNNIFIKGAIAHSNLYMDKNIVIGKALIDAYNLEEKYSIYPRIILSTEVSEKVNNYIEYYADKKNCPVNSRCLIDKDGFIFINYLNYLLDFYIDGDGDEIQVEIEKELLTHKKIIIKNLNLFKTNDRVFKKFEWIANYHNYFCNSLLNKNKYAYKNLIINKKYFTSINRIIR